VIEHFHLDWNRQLIHQASLQLFRGTIILKKIKLACMGFLHILSNKTNIQGNIGMGMSQV
jgi:hypothetical protein